MTVLFSVLQPMRVIVITDLSDKQSETSDFWLEREREREREKGRCEVVEVFLSFHDWKIVWVLRGGQLEKK